MTSISLNQTYAKALDGIDAAIRLARISHDSGLRIVFPNTLPNSLACCYGSLSKLFPELKACYPKARKELEGLRGRLPNKDIVTACGQSDVFALDIAYKAMNQAHTIACEHTKTLPNTQKGIAVTLDFYVAYGPRPADLSELRAKVEAEKLDVAFVLSNGDNRPSGQSSGNGKDGGEVALNAIKATVTSAVAASGAAVTKPAGSKTLLPIDLERWAIGHDGTKWRLFQNFPNKKKEILQDRGGVDLSGHADTFARELAKRGGKLTKKDAIALFRGKAAQDERDMWDDDKFFKSRVKPARRTLAGEIKTAIKRVTKNKITLDNPLPWNQNAEAWIAAVQVGYTICDKRNRQCFRLCDELSQDQSMDLHVP